jgi:hypothetical protein
MIERRGYRWVTLGEAMKDPAYKTPDDFVGTNGPSWLHRWRVREEAARPDARRTRSAAVGDRPLKVAACHEREYGRDGRR